MPGGVHGYGDLAWHGYGFLALHRSGVLAWHGYGVLVVLGAAAAIGLTIRHAPRYGLPPFDALGAGLFAVSGGLGGAAGLYWALHRDGSTGLVFYGGLAGGIAGAAAYCRSYAISFSQLAEAAAPGLALGQAVGRLGCMIGGCCYGHPAPPGWPALAVDGVARHPVQLYEALALALLFALLDRARGRVRLLSLYLAGHGLIRLATEQLRGDDLERGRLATLFPSQLFACLSLVAGIWLLYRERERPTA
jgi:phosphatidylglycerol:prolipoprotein diacylglycerol transferase